MIKRTHADERCGMLVTSNWSVLPALLALAFLVGCSGTPDGDSANNSDSGDGIRSVGSEQPSPELTANESPAASPKNNEQDSGEITPDVQAVLDGMTLSEQERTRTAEFYLRQGQKNFAEADYRSAAKNFEEALRNNPKLQSAREGLAQSQMFLGRRDGEIRTIFEQLGEEVEVLEQERLSEVRQLIASARRALADGEAGSALRDATRARERLIFFNYDADTTELQREAQALYEQARGEKLRIDAEAERRRQESAGELADRLRREEEDRRRERVAALTAKVQDAMIRQDYRNALITAERILDLDPENDVAMRLSDRANERLMAQRVTNYRDLNQKQVMKVWEDLERSAIPYETPFNFPDDERFWREEVQRRMEGLANSNLDESPEIRKIRQALATVSPGFTFNDQSLEEVIGFLRTISDLNIIVDSEIDTEEATVTLSLQNVKLGEALDLILENTGLAYTFKENTLFITTPENAFGDKIFDIYNVTDILNKIRDFPGPTIQVRSNDDSDDGGGSPFDFGGDEDEEAVLDPDSLVELIIESTGGQDAWDESESVITPSSGQLLVNATREQHLALASFLENLRANSDVFVIVEARFIDMVDDFLEDIGVDSRNLGQPPGQGFGTAFGVLNSSRSGGSDPGFNNAGNGTTDPALAMGQDRTAGRIEHILDGFVGAASGERLNAALRGLTLQVSWLDPFQINAIVRATQEQRSARTVTSPRVTASNGQRVHVSVVTERSYVQDYELVSGGTGLVVSEVADPVIEKFQDGVVLDVRPVISSDRKYITLDVRPTLASLINGIISTVTISLGTLNAAASQVEIDLPEISLQQAFTSVTVPDGGTVLLGGFRSLNEAKYESSIPLLGKLPLIKNAFRRKAYLNEKRSLYILITAKVVDLRAQEKQLYN